MKIKIHPLTESEIRERDMLISYKHSTVRPIIEQEFNRLKELNYKYAAGVGKPNEEVFFIKKLNWNRTDKPVLCLCADFPIDTSIYKYYIYQNMDGVIRVKLPNGTKTTHASISDAMGFCDTHYLQSVKNLFI